MHKYCFCCRWQKCVTKMILCLLLQYLIFRKLIKLQFFCVFVHAVWYFPCTKILFYHQPRRHNKYLLNTRIWHSAIVNFENWKHTEANFHCDKRSLFSILLVSDFQSMPVEYIVISSNMCQYFNFFQKGPVL